ncbi:hypothetical protein BN1723_002478 [Verticillium longisporum]|uniref:Inosine/uridine-preferring nucleoside hydrolase domain-containing protein n=1 Tax=Verticillium longisporum TaxID=100787 RepID=A0A0G4L8I6_VERLO|nr:hypothetical protein BN1723_002478 [Verticillium longisporum]
MNNDQFRRLVGASSSQSGSPSNGSSASTASPAGATPSVLGSRQRSSIPMTPRSVGGGYSSRNEFARQLAARNNPDQAQKKFRTSAPKGSRLAEGYVGDEERIGNYTPWAEFNIIADPEAAAFLCDDPVISPKLTFIPLDLTHQVLATEHVRDLLLYGEGGPKTGAGKTTLRQMLVELLMFFAKTYADVFGITDGPPLHDPLAVVVALIGTPHEIAFRDFDAAAAGSGSVKYRERFEVKVETDGSYADALEGKTQTGRTICRKLEAGSAGVAIPRGIDVPKFWKVLEECIQRADEANAGAVKGLAEKGPLHV